MTDVGRRPVVLLVEDYQDTREMYRDYLEFSGFTVATAWSWLTSSDPRAWLAQRGEPVLLGVRGSARR